MAEVFSSNSPCMLGKRVLSPHSHGTLMGGQLDFSSKKRRLGQGLDQAGSFDRSESYQQHQHQQQQRSPSPVRAGKRARPLSPLQPSAHFPSGGAAAGEAASSSHGASGFFGGGSFSQHQHQHQHQQKAHRMGAEDGELAALRREVAALQAHAAEKESDLNMAREENGRLKEGMGMFQKELERLSAENRILKRAVGIQNTKGKEV
ncbi:unnamed protein product, partial [Ectocarpus sp. 12 AP-2014]